MSLLPVSPRPKHDGPSFHARGGVMGLPNGNVSPSPFDMVELCVIQQPIWNSFLLFPKKSFLLLPAYYSSPLLLVDLCSVGFPPSLGNLPSGPPVSPPPLPPLVSPQVVALSTLNGRIQAQSSF